MCGTSTDEYWKAAITEVETLEARIHGKLLTVMKI